MYPKYHLAILLLIGASLIVITGATFQGELKPLLARENASGHEETSHTQRTALAAEPAEMPYPDVVLPPKCRDERTVVIRPQTDGYTVRLPISWQTHISEATSSDFYAVCALSGVLNEAYGADGEVYTDWTIHQVDSTADAWFKAAVEVKDSTVKAIVASQRLEVKDSTLTSADFHSIRSMTTIDGRPAIRYTTFWDKPQNLEGGATMERFYIIADKGQVYVFMAETTRGPHEAEVMGLFDAVVKTVRFAPQTI